MKKLLLFGMVAALLTGCSLWGTIDEAGNEVEDAVQNGLAGEVTSGSEDVVEAGDILHLEHLRNGQFGFADMLGERLITFEGERPTEGSTSYELAIGDSGTVLKIEYQQTQQADSQDNGRATMYNFDHMTGSVYAVTEGTAKPNETYFLTASENWVASRALAVDSSEMGQPADDQSMIRIEAAKNRAILMAELVALIGEDSTLYLVQFERQGNSMLASLVLQVNDSLSFLDFPADYDSNSTWRVDDQGVIIAEHFQVMFAGTAEDGRIVAVTWLGFEGENSFILAQEGNALKETGIQAGRYTAPE